ncbi:hypothetical protein EWM64_g10882, partial [Hericium alpestre]
IKDIFDEVRKLETMFFEHIKCAFQASVPSSLGCLVFFSKHSCNLFICDLPLNVQHIRPARTRTQHPVLLPPCKLSADDIEHIRAKMKEQLGGCEPRVFQLDLMQAQEEQRDALCQAATGQGKTAVAAGQYTLEKNADRITLMVSLLIGLQNKMAETF